MPPGLPPAGSEGPPPIYHMLPRNSWVSGSTSAAYAAPSRREEGFIHFTAERERLLAVANAFYRDHPGEFIILAIDPARVTAEIHLSGLLAEATFDAETGIRPMSVLTDRLPGWFKRKKEGEQTTPTTSSGTSVTTGGGLGQEPVVVWDATNVMEAEIVKGRLESEGIPAFIRSEAVGGLYGLTAGNLAAAQVFVPAPLAEKALDLLTGDGGDLENESAEGQTEEESFAEDEEQGAA